MKLRLENNKKNSGTKNLRKIEQNDSMNSHFFRNFESNNDVNCSYIEVSAAVKHLYCKTHSILVQMQT